MQRIFRCYMSDVGRALCCPGRMKRQILRELRDDLEDYRSDGGEMTRSAVEAAFGAPEEYALGYVQTMTEEELDAALRRAKMIRIVTVIACALIILGVLTFAIVFAVWNSQTATDSYFEIVIETSHYFESIRRIS